MIKKILLICLLTSPLTVQAQDPPVVDATQAQSLLDALRECNDRQTALLAEQRALGENILHIRERINQININILGVQSNTQQIIAAHGGFVKVSKFFEDHDQRIIYGVMGLAVFGVLCVLNLVRKGFNWLTTSSEKS